MKHLSTVDFLRDLARRVDADYDRDRLEVIADRLDATNLGEVRRLLDNGHPAPPAPGSTETLAGGTITPRPDLAYTEAAQQAVAQGEAGGYLPLRKAPLQPITHLVAGNGGTIQAPTPLHPAEPAKIGTGTR